MCAIVYLAEKIRFEIQIVRGREMEPHAAELGGEVVEIARAVDVAEDAVRDAVLLHEGEDVHGPAALVVGRVVKHAEDAPRAGRFRQREAPLEAALFAPQDRRVAVREIPGRLGEPAPRAREGDIPHAEDIVVEEFERAARGPGHLRHRVPPVVVVAPDDDLPAGELRDPQEIRERLRQIAPPREVACEDDRVFRTDRREPGAADLLAVVLPVLAEDVHRLRRRIPGEMEIAECVQFHGYLSAAEIPVGAERVQHVLPARAVRHLRDAVAHEEGARRVPREDLHPDAAADLIEEEVIAVAGDGEIAEHEARDGLDGIGEAVCAAVLLERHIELRHTADGVIRERHVAVRILVKERAEEILRVDVFPVVIMVEADDLRMGMALGAARAGPEVAEIEDRTEFRPRRGLPPFLHTEGDHLMELLRAVEGDVAVVLRGLHEHRGPRIAEDGVLVHEPDHVAPPLEDVRERFRTAEGTGRALRGVGLLLPDMQIELDRVRHDITLFLPERRGVRHLYYIMAFLSRQIWDF